MTDQPPLFDYTAPPPPRPVCGECGSPAVVVSFGIVVCSVCRAGAEHAETARQASITRARNKRLAIRRNRR